MMTSVDGRARGPADGPAPGLTIFFPAYNDAGTIASMVVSAVLAARRLTPDYEVVVVNDASTDATGPVLDELASVYPCLRVVHHGRNRGYGGALRTGFATARKPLLFYTDGDAQYDPAEVSLLWERLTDDVDLVNGYKIGRSDPFHRLVVGRLYHWGVKLLFGLGVRDVDCDFRLMRRSVLDVVTLQKSSGAICLELMKKAHDAGVRIAEVPVHHYHRAYGKSQFFNIRRIAGALADVMDLWYRLVIRREHLSAPGGEASRVGLDRVGVAPRDASPAPAEDRTL
jgi:glycosyltransferase involved in cell wall biosynthesis